GIETLSDDDIASLLQVAERMDVNRPQPLLAGRRIVLLFYEASTRTRVSFEMAAKALGATTYLVHATASSVEKGETLLDTGLTLRSMTYAPIERSVSPVSRRVSSFSLVGYVERTS